MKLIYGLLSSSFLLALGQDDPEIGTHYGSRRPAIPKVEAVDSYGNVPSRQELLERKYGDDNDRSVMDPIRRHVPGVNCGNPAQSQGRLVGGAEAKDNEYPWMVSIQVCECADEYCGTAKADCFRCGGSILNELYVLTAAHCVDLHLDTFGLYIDYPTLMIAGTNDRMDKGPETEDEGSGASDYPTYGASGLGAPYFPNLLLFNEVKVHNNWDGTTLKSGFDIALIDYLAHNPNFKLDTTYFWPACLPTAGECLDDGDTVSLSGWGIDENGSEPIMLQDADLPVVDTDTCVSHWGTVRSSQVCAGGEDGIGACLGDSGAPLVVQKSDGYFYHYGITSYGSETCGTDGVATVFTRTTAFLRWIQWNTYPRLVGTNNNGALWNPYSDSCDPGMDHGGGADAFSYNLVDDCATGTERDDLTPNKWMKFGRCGAAAECDGGRDDSLRAYVGKGQCCYCDSHCVSRKDCCGDYHQMCNANFDQDTCVAKRCSVEKGRKKYRCKLDKCTKGNAGLSTFATCMKETCGGLVFTQAKACGMGYCSHLRYRLNKDEFSAQDGHQDDCLAFIKDANNQRFYKKTCQQTGDQDAVTVQAWIDSFAGIRGVGYCKVATVRFMKRCLRDGTAAYA